MNLLKITSISKKIMLALLGGFLVVFLLVHMGINLCLLRNDGGAWYLAASHFMGTNYIVKVFEVVLLLAVLGHICLAIMLQIQNWASRPVRYKKAHNSKTSFMSKHMIWTGGLVLCFLAIHFVNFYFVKHGFVEGKYLVEVQEIQEHVDQDTYMAAMQGMLSPEETAAFQQQMGKLQTLIESGVQSKDGKYILGVEKESIKAAFGEDYAHFEPDFYTMCKELFQQKGYSILYLILFVVLGLHLFHAFQSLFQTLGLSHNKYNGVIKYASLIYTIVVVAGFAIIPIYFMFFFKG